jgi:hypothetical protein
MDSYSVHIRFTGNTGIPKDSVPASLAGKVVEPCVLCGGLGFSESYAIDNNVCAKVLEAWRDEILGVYNANSIDECNFLQNQCIVCNDSEESNEVSTRLSALNPFP